MIFCKHIWMDLKVTFMPVDDCYYREVTKLCIKCRKIKVFYEVEH